MKLVTFLWSLNAAIALVLLTRSVLLSMLVSMLIFFLLRSWLA